MVSCSGLRFAILRFGLSLSVGIVVSLLLLRLRFVLWLPLLLLFLSPAAARSFNAFARTRIAHGRWAEVFTTDIRIAEALPRSLWAAGPRRAAASNAS